MEIAISKGTFSRRVDNDVFFSNPRSGASMVIDSGGAIYDSIVREFKPLDCVFAKIAECYGITLDVVENDFSGIINDMIGEGLLDFRGVGYKDEKQFDSVLSCNQGSDKKSSAIIKDDPVGTFYRMRRLPLALHIDVTSNCTERCVHCYLPDYAAKYLPFADIEKALIEFRGLNGLTVYISGGECMTHPKFDQILMRCRELDFNIIVLSNLTLCDNEKVRLFKDVDPQYVNVSLYSMEPEEHDAITMVCGSWDKTMSAILALESAGIDVRIAAPLLKINRHAFSDLKDFADKHNMHLVPDFGIIAKSNHDRSNLQYACSAMELEEALRKNKELFDMEWLKVCRDDINATLCDIGVFRIHLNSNGDYYPCPSMYGYVLANVKDTSLNDVWMGEKLQYLRDIRLKDLKQCVSCEHKNFCEPCLAYNFNATGNLFKTIPERCKIAAIVHGVYG